MENFKTKSKIEAPKSLSPEKQELLAMEKEGRYVFHGTAVDVDLLHPQQAIDTERGPDGEPAIFASPAADFAIFHAIITKQNFPQRLIAESGAITNDGVSFELKFGLPRGALEGLTDSASGFVYVFDKNKFTQIEGRPAEYISRVPVQPLQKIKVLKRDLPDGIDS